MTRSTSMFATMLVAMGIGVVPTHAADLGLTQQTAGEFLAALAPEDRAKVLAGEVVLVEKVSSKDDEDDSTMGGGVVYALVDASVDAVWGELRNVDSHVEFVPRLAKISKYIDEGDRIGLDCTIKVAFHRVRYHVIQDWNPKEHTMVWSLDETRENDIDGTEGRWQLEPYEDGKCLIVYRLNADSGAALPGWLERYLLNRDLPDVVAAFKKRAESGGTWTK